MPSGLNPISAAYDLGLGDILNRQQMDETEEEKRRRRLGLSSMTNGNPFGLTGIAAADLGAAPAGAAKTAGSAFSAGR